MAISPEVKPRVSVTTDYEIPPLRSTAAESRKDRLESGSNNSIGYALGILVLLVIGYFAYMYYEQNTVMPTTTNQSTTTIAPSVVPPAPSATAPAAPATPPATTTTP
jgi:hypothetical protein